MAEKTAQQSQMVQIYETLMGAVPDLTEAQAGNLQGNRHKLASSVRALLMTMAGGHFNQLLEWEKLYREIDLPIDLSHMHVPLRQDDASTLVVVHPAFTIEKLLFICSRFFPVWRWTEECLDTITFSDRVVELDPYAIWIRESTSATPDAGRRVDEVLDGYRVGGSTLMERILYEFKRCHESQSPQDTSTITLCRGTRDVEGGIPGVSWIDGALCIHPFVPPPNAE